MSEKPKVAFICTHNSCRSQIAEAISKLYATNTYDSYSAGTEIKNQINQDAVHLIQKLYGVNMEETQYPKLLSEIPPVDIVITMGCGVQCPYLACKYREDWGIEDPTGKSEEEFIKTEKIIASKVKELMLRIKNFDIQLNS